MPSGEVGADRRALFLIVLAILAVHLALAATLPLTEDEAYYRLWSMAPAAGYFDHPPMIAWSIAAGRALFGDNPLGVRIFACLGCALTTLLVFDLATTLGLGEAVAARAGVWWNATLLVVAGGLLAVPDAPASLFWTAALACLARAERGRGLGWWAAAGAAGGLAALSKYSALFLGPGVLMWLVVRREGRARLTTLGPWLALALAGGLFAINLVWNAQHHWLTFAKQFGRIAPHRFDPKYVAELVLGQALLLNPLLTAVLLRGGREPWRRLPLIAAASAPFALYLLLHALHDRVQAHWPAPLYPGLAIVAALAAERGPRGRLAAAVPVAGFSLAAAGALILLLPVLGIALPLDPAAPLRGWRAFSEEVEGLRAGSGAAWVGPTSYGLTAQLLDHSAIQAPVMQIAERDRWRGLATPVVDASRPGLVVDLARRLDPHRLAACFADVRLLGTIRRAAAGERGATYAVFEVSGPRRDLVRDGC